MSIYAVDRTRKKSGGYTVRGGHASSYEYNVAAALDTLELGFDFQFSVSGGRRLRGGSVIDFWVFTTPLPTPLFVNGEYWHRDSSRESFQKAIVEQALRGSANPVVVLWGYETSTYDAALAACRQKLL